MKLDNDGESSFVGRTRSTSSQEKDDLVTQEIKSILWPEHQRDERRDDAKVLLVMDEREERSSEMLRVVDDERDDVSSDLPSLSNSVAAAQIHLCAQFPIQKSSDEPQSETATVQPQQPMIADSAGISSSLSKALSMGISTENAVATGSNVLVPDGKEVSNNTLPKATCLESEKKASLVSSAAVVGQDSFAEQSPTSESKACFFSKSRGQMTGRIVESPEYDSEEEPPLATIRDRLHWRLDPSDSLSDWKIEVLVASDDKETTIVDIYHVHKVHLAAGAHCSEYFSRLFKDAGTHTQSQSFTSRIDLHKLAASAFPLLLDFLYAPDGQLELSTGNATALHWLGKRFEIRRLQWEAKRFWKNTLSTRTCVTYYEHAKLLQDEILYAIASQYIVNHIDEIQITSRLLHVSDADFWLHVLQSYDGSETRSLHLSKLIAHFCALNQITAETFRNLTQEKFLPYIDGEAALSLLEVERSVTSPDPMILSDLQKRCIEALAYCWDSIEFSSAAHMALLQKQHPVVLSTILIQMVDAAKWQSQDLAQELGRFQRAPNNPRTGPYTGSGSTASWMPEVGEYPLEGQLLWVNVGQGSGQKFYPLFYYDAAK